MSTPQMFMVRDKSGGIYWLTVGGDADAATIRVDYETPAYRDDDGNFYPVFKRPVFSGEYHAGDSLLRSFIRDLRGQGLNALAEMLSSGRASRD
ncbi:hypothetical protein CVV65_02180 [Kyrpidia spormannii]|uniref:Uncharacterized protein n=1 Tax=Kyrpidia spormannii TaxID=2055160 RepID=A0A2K8N333_9BACL|nr:hypothetical protein [Kyrpidia spormannii]ATY83919.1 hypothetical protein CVV65_02180 [Kyrpidia spormannii]